MRRRLHAACGRAALVALALLGAPAPLGAQGGAAPPAAEFAVVDARVFDGERVLPRATVVVRNGRIAGVTARPPARLPAVVVDGRGHTLLPGLIDAHFHAQTREDALAEAVRFGVTTVLDMFSRPEHDARLRGAALRPDRADYHTAGTVATAPGGHGTRSGFAIPTLTSPDSADAFVAARVAEGSEFLKIIVEPGTGSAGAMAALDSATVRALAAAARRRGLRTVAHVSRAADAELALRAGVDGLAHVWWDTGHVPELARLAAARRAFVVPTFGVGLRTLLADGIALAADGRIRPYLSDASLRLLTDTSRLARMPDSVAARYRANAARVRADRRAAAGGLHRAGVRLLAGSDARNDGVAPGASLHAELLALVESGLTPTEALAAATSAPADAFGLRDRGRIRPGARADLLLVEGDPTADVTATRGIAGVWKAGARLERGTGVADTRAVAAAQPGGHGTRHDLQAPTHSAPDSSAARAQSRPAP